MAGSVALSFANMGAAVSWTAPTYSTSRPLWRFAERATSQAEGIIKHKATREIAFPTGGRLVIHTSDGIGARGEDFDLAIVDEAARVPEEYIYDTLMPTLADRDGRLMLISTPKGRNYFWREFIQGQDDPTGYRASITAPTSANPIPAIRQAAERARVLVSARTYRQEWLAEFIDDGTLFVNVRECARARAQERAAPGHSYVMGIDWARAAGGDFSVFLVMDVQERAVVHMTRLQGKPFDVQLAILRGVYEAFGRCPVIAEANNMGQALIEQLQAQGLPIVPFQTTAASKHDIISALEIAFDQRDIAILPDENMVAECLAYERHERTGYPHYSAPDGLHDDIVMALALAWSNMAQAGRWWYE